MKMKNDFSHSPTCATDWIVQGRLTFHLQYDDTGGPFDPLYGQVANLVNQCGNV